jgi:hypothetical protein
MVLAKPYIKITLKLGNVTHACNFSSWEARQENHEFESTLDYIGRPCLKKNQEDSGIVVAPTNL